MFILDAKTGTVLDVIAPKQSSWLFRVSNGDYAGDIVSSFDGTKAYAGFYGNTWYGTGGIIVIDMNRLQGIQSFGLHGSRSLSITNDGRLFTSAFYTLREGKYLGEPEKRGIVELVPIENGTNFLFSRILFVSLLSTMNEPYYDSGNIFYKAGTLVGDITGDRKVDFTDFGIMAFHWLRTIPPETILSADLNADKKVDLKDFTILANNWLEDNSG